MTRQFSSLLMAICAFGWVLWVVAEEIDGERRVEWSSWNGDFENKLACEREQEDVLSRLGAVAEKMIIILQQLIRWACERFNTHENFELHLFSLSPLLHFQGSTNSPPHIPSSSALASSSTSTYSVEYLL